MMRQKRALLVSLGTVVLALTTLVPSCAAATSSSSSTTSHTNDDAGPAVSAISAGILQAAIAPITNVAYVTGSGTVTYHFIAYYSYSGSYVTVPYTLTGTHTEVTGPGASLNGAVNFTGGTVIQMAYNNVVGSPPSGTYQITFSGGAVYTYNLATGTFILK
jgi:hypothetical protein